MDELNLEIGYTEATFDITKTLRELSSFATLVGGDHAQVVEPIVRHCSTDEQGELEYTLYIATLERRLCNSSWHLRILLSFPFDEELIADLAQAYNISMDEARTYSNGKEVSLGYATAYIGCYEERATVLILPDTDRLGHVMMTSSVVRSHLVNFCHVTEAVEAFWENDEEEVVMTIWPKAATTIEEEHTLGTITSNWQLAVNGVVRADALIGDHAQSDLLAAHQ